MHKLAALNIGAAVTNHNIMVGSYIYLISGRAISAEHHQLG